MRAPFSGAFSALRRNDDDRIAFARRADKQAGKFQWNSDAAMGGPAFAHEAAVNGHAILGQAQHIGHGRVIAARMMIGILFQYDETSRGSGFAVGAIEYDRRTDLMTAAKNGKQLAAQVDAHPDASTGNMLL